MILTNEQRLTLATRKSATWAYGPPEDYACEHGQPVYFRWEWPINDGIEHGEAVILDNSCPICSGEDEE